MKNAAISFTDGSLFSPHFTIDLIHLFLCAAEAIFLPMLLLIPVIIGMAVCHHNNKGRPKSALVAQQGDHNEMV
jgi:hypothetical protein